MRATSTSRPAGGSDERPIAAMTAPVLRGPRCSNAPGLPDRLSHVAPVRSAVFDEPNLVSHAGLVPVVGLAGRAGLIDLADRHLTVPGGPGHAAG